MEMTLRSKHGQHVLSFDSFYVPKGNDERSKQALRDTRPPLKDRVDRMKRPL